jgi:hypothetical protein
LYHYFVHNNEESGISFNRIKRILEGMCTQESDDKFKKYVPLYDLMRYGLIELIGKNTYRLSPSSMIWSPDCILGINEPKIDDNSITESYLGLHVINKSMFDGGSDAVQPFDFKNSIRVIPNIRSIISSSFKEWVGEIGNGVAIECYTTNVWKSSKITDGTFFKIRFGSNQFLFKYIVKLSSGRCFEFERAEFEKYNFALMMHSINEFPLIKGLLYNCTTQTLDANAFGFPIVIERLLFINHILETGNISLTKQYHLAEQDFKYLNKIFHNKINKI